MGVFNGIKVNIASLSYLVLVHELQVFIYWNAAADLCSEWWGLVQGGNAVVVGMSEALAAVWGMCVLATDVCGLNVSGLTGELTDDLIADPSTVCGLAGELTVVCGLTGDTIAVCAVTGALWVVCGLTGSLIVLTGLSGELMVVCGPTGELTGEEGGLER